jgi:glycerol transport system ATP-binding protein
MLFKSHVEIPVIGKLPDLPDADYTIAFRPNHLYLQPISQQSIGVKAKVAVTEITGSDSYIHVDVAGLRWVVLAHSIQSFDIEETIEVFLEPDRFYVFDNNDQLVVTPAHIAAA